MEILEVESIIHKVEGLQNRLTLLEEIKAERSASKLQINVMMICLVIIAVASLSLVAFFGLFIGDIKDNVQAIYTLLLSV